MRRAPRWHLLVAGPAELIALVDEVAAVIKRDTAGLADGELEALRAELQRAHDHVGGEIVRRASRDRRRSGGAR
jgi:hypothetical protein